MISAGLARNIQDIKDREEELIKMRQLAEQAELKQSFIKNMSHEIRTPLNAIAGFASLLVAAPSLPDEEKREMPDIINSNTRLLLKLIDDVLEISKIDSGTLSLFPRKERLHRLMENIYQSHFSIVRSPLKFLKDFPVDQDAIVDVDGMRLAQVIGNLLSNANKFTEEGYVKLGYSHVPGSTEVRIYVEDTGIGIPVEEQHIIFERFYKHSEFLQGVGLGLPICQLLVQKMEGRIELNSVEHKGSRFTIVLSCESI
jgi:signal transduction histidine kinase